MENHLGRLLDKNEIVHHKNEDKHDNRLENLQLMKVGEHATYHGLKHGRKYVVLKCPHCKVFFDMPENKTYLAKNGSYTCCCNSCRGSFSREIQLNGQTKEVESAISENLQKRYVKFLDNPEATKTILEP
jgi:hypothetical protein